MGFYGKLTGTTRLNFQFDKVYSNRTAMDNGAATDSVAVGRLVLIEYSSSPTNDYVDTYCISNTVGSNLDKFYAYGNLDEQRVWNGQVIKRAKLNSRDRKIFETFPSGLKANVGKYVQAFPIGENYRREIQGQSCYIAKLTNTEGNFKWIENSENIDITKPHYAVAVAYIEDISSPSTDPVFLLNPLERIYNTAYDRQMDALYESPEGFNVVQKEEYIAKLKKGKLTSEAVEDYFIVYPQDVILTNRELVFMTFDGLTEDKDDLVIASPEEDSYYKNYITDKKTFNKSFDGKGYDSTVWQKTYVNGHFKYVNIAELNSAVPSFGLTVDAPSIVPTAPHFDKDQSNNLYYKVHWTPSWGLRVKASDPNLTGQKIIDNELIENSAVKVSEDENTYGSDMSTKWVAKALNAEGGLVEYVYCKENNSTEFKWVQKANLDKNPNRYDANIPAAIYWNKDGFDPQTGVKDETSESFIKLVPSGKSGQIYENHDGTEAQAQVDTYEFSLQLPGIGNAIAGFWDVVYGEAEQLDDGTFLRDTDLSWKNASEVNRKPSYSIYSKEEFAEENGQTFAGIVHSAQDILGMNIEPITENQLSLNGLDGKDINPDWIYTCNGKYYRKVLKTRYRNIDIPTDRYVRFKDLQLFFPIQLEDQDKIVNNETGETLWQNLSIDFYNKFICFDGLTSLTKIKKSFDAGLNYYSESGRLLSEFRDEDTDTLYSLIDFYEFFTSSSFSSTILSSLTFFFEPNKYYIKTEKNNYELVSDEQYFKANKDRAYYACLPVVITEDTSNIQTIGVIWDTRVGEVPDSISLGYSIYNGFTFEEIEDFAKDRGTLNGLVLSLEEKIKGKSSSQRDDYSAQGISNKIKDLSSKIGRIYPNRLAAINNYGQIESVDIRGNGWIQTKLYTERKAEQGVNLGDSKSVTTKGQSSIYTIGSSEQLILNHREVPLNNSNFIYESLDEAENSGLIELYVDGAGHVRVKYQIEEENKNNSKNVKFSIPSINSLATSSTNGLMSSADKDKIDSLTAFNTLKIINQQNAPLYEINANSEKDLIKIKQGANISISKTNDGYIMISANDVDNLNFNPTGTVTQPIFINNNGIFQTIDYTIESSVPKKAKFTDTTYETFTQNVAGLVPPPVTYGEEQRYLCENGQWENIPIYQDVSITQSGLMTAEDKIKLNGIDKNANNYTLPKATSEAFGGVKVGKGITVEGGVITVNEDNILDVLGYHPISSVEIYTNSECTEKMSVNLTVKTNGEGKFYF